MWKKLAFLALLGAVAAVLIRMVRPRPDFTHPENNATAEWPPLDLPTPAPPAPADTRTDTETDTAQGTHTDRATPSWVEPDPSGNCPDGYPVKLKLTSGIFHVPGGLSYDRTNADRCYVDTASAEADGFRQSRR